MQVGTGNVKKKHSGSYRTIISLHFFKQNENTVTVNSERYASTIEEFCLPKLEEMDMEDVWFQRDVIAAHTSRTSMNLLPNTSQNGLFFLGATFSGQRDRQIQPSATISCGATLKHWLT